MEIFNKLTAQNKCNFVFLGEAGSGKSEVSLNFAAALNRLDDKKVHFFDLDMTKPLFRSRTSLSVMEELGIIFHFENQFMDAPTLVGGVIPLLRDEDCYVVMDVGGDHIGARAIGGFSDELNKGYSKVYYVLNAFRPWSYDLDHIDHTLVDIMGVTHIPLEQITMINNPNFGPSTTPENFAEGSSKMEGMIRPHKDIEFSCVSESLYEEVKEMIPGDLMPLHLYLTYPWLS